VVDASYDNIFLHKIPKEALELFEHLCENSHFHATSNILNCVDNWKGGIYEVSHSIDISSKVDTLTKKFDQLLCMNKVLNAPSMQDVYSICADPMHAYVDYLCIRKSDYVIEQETTA